jgi:hypothetical protein
MYIQVPTYLRPENLRVKRDIFGSTSMTVSWDHPRAKKPENGYRLVFAPFTPISSQKPWFQDIDGNTNEVCNACYYEIAWWLFDVKRLFLLSKSN